MGQILDLSFYINFRCHFVLKVFFFSASQEIKIKILVFLGAVTHRAVTITSKLKATEEWTFKVRFRLY